jgi:N-acetylneuraminate lyase
MITASRALHLQGLVAPALTPMRADGSLDLPAIDRLAAYFAERRLAGVFVCGTTGEGPSLTVQERRQVLERWCAAAKGLFPVIAQVGAASIADARDLAAHARAAGAAAVAALPPFYLRPRSVHEALECCADVASAAGNLPFYYYHIPYLTGVRLSMTELLDSATKRVPTFGGMKFSDGDLEDFGRCLTAAGERMDLFFGKDEVLLAALALGATAAIGSTYNYAAPLYQSMIRSFAAGDLPGARRAQALSRRLVQIIEQFGGSRVHKSLMHIAGVPCGPNRLPLPTLTGLQHEALELALEDAGLMPFIRPEGSEGR